MERETTTITTEKGTVIKIKAFFTQSERVQIQKLLAGDSKVSEEGEAETKVTDLLDAQAKAVELALVSVNESADGAFKTLTDDLPASEYDAVSSVVMAMIQKDLVKAK